MKESKNNLLNFIFIILFILVIFLLVFIAQNKIFTGNSVQEEDRIKLIEDCGEETILYDFGNQCWQKSAKPEPAKNWSDAEEYCKSLTLANHSDWKLPTLDELWTIRNYIETNSELFKDSHFWSSTKLKKNVYWYMDFRINYKGFTSGFREGYGVKCIRDNYY